MFALDVPHVVPVHELVPGEALDLGTPVAQVELAAEMAQRLSAGISSALDMRL